MVEFDPGSECRTGVLVLEHPGLLDLGIGHVVPIPSLVVGEPVVRRKQGMRFAVALNLRRFDHRLPAAAQGRILRGHGASGEVGLGEHDAVGEIGVVGNGQHPAARAALVVVHVAPQVGGIVAVELRVGLHLRDARKTVSKNQVAVDVVSPRHRRPFVADQRGETAGVIGGVGGSQRAMPYAGLKGGRCWVAVLFGVKACHELIEYGLRVVGIDVTAPAFAECGGHERRLLLVDAREHAHVLRVVGHHQKVQGAAQTVFTAVDAHGFALRETIGILGTEQRVPQKVSIWRAAGMHVGVAPQQFIGMARERRAAEQPRQQPKRFSAGHCR